MHSFVRCSFIQQPFREHRAGTVVPGTGTDSLHAAHVLTPPNHGRHTAAGGGPIPCRTMPFFHWEEDFRRNSAHISGAFPPETDIFTHPVGCTVDSASGLSLLLGSAALVLCLLMGGKGEGGIFKQGHRERSSIPSILKLSTL